MDGNADREHFRNLRAHCKFYVSGSGTLTVYRGGTQIQSGDIVHTGDILNITVAPNSGNVLDDISVTGGTLDDNGGGSYTFTITASEPGGSIDNTGYFTPGADMSGGAVPGITVEFVSDGTVPKDAETPADGDAWQEADLVIYTAEELLTFANVVNGGDTFAGQVVRLGGDIDLSRYADWVGIGSYNPLWSNPSNIYKAFSGTFDGDGYTVTLATSGTGNQGLFHSLDGAIIKNLTVDGSVTTTSVENDVAVAAGIAVYAGNSQIINCVNRADITNNSNASASCDAAGIVARSYYGPYWQAQVATITPTGKTINDTLVKACVNYGTITQNFGLGKAAGIAAYADRIEDCGNEGAVTGVQAAAGIATTGSNITPYSISRSYNAGAITATGQGAYASGISGVAHELTVTDCYNLGAIRNEGMPSGNSGSGRHVAAGILRLAERNGTVTNNYNMGTLWVSSPPFANNATSTGETADIYADVPVLSGNRTNNYGANDTFTAADLNSAVYVDIDGRSPALKWQTANPAYTITFSGEVTIAGRGTATTFTLPIGRYSYTAASGASGTFNVTNGEKSIALSANVTFTNLTEQGATVEVKCGDAPQTAITPGAYTLQNGLYSYEISRGGSVLDSGEFVVAGINRTIAVISLAPRTDVTFSVTPANAAVSVKNSNSKALQSKPGEPYVFSLYEGEYTYTVTANGYVPQSGTFSDTDGTVSVTLIRQKVRISFNVTPINVTPAIVVTLNGETVDPDTPGGIIYQLYQGETYEYTVTAAPYETKSDSYTVNGAGTVTVKLTAPPGVYLPGWDKWRPSFGIYIMNRDGTTGTQIGNWNYDTTQNTYVDGSEVEAPFITDFTANPLVYSGVDKMPAARLGVVTKGILAEDLIAYYNANREIAGVTYPTLDAASVGGFDLKLATNSAAIENPYDSNDPTRPGQWPWSAAFDTLTNTTRYYYPDFLIGANTGTSQTSDDTTTDPLMAKPLGTGTAVKAVLAVTSYNERITRDSGDGGALGGSFADLTALNNGIAQLFELADQNRALRNFEGMIPEFNTLDADTPGARPLGHDGSYYIGSVWFTPPYKDIAVTGGAITYTGAVDFPKAFAGETVTFTIDGSDPLADVTVNGTPIENISGREYSFTMPDADVVINIEIADAIKVAYLENENGAVTATVEGENVSSSAETVTLDATIDAEVKSVALTIPKEVIGKLVAAIDNTETQTEAVAVVTDIGTVTLTKEVIAIISTAVEETHSVELTIERKADAADVAEPLPEDEYTSVTVFELTLKVDGEPIYTDTADTTANTTVELKYHKTPGNTLHLWYVDGNTKTEVDFIETTTGVRFITTHFSLYAVEEIAAQSEHTITASAGAHGAISPNGAVSVANGASQTFTFTPESGYKVSTIAIDGGTATPYSETSYTFPNVTAPHTIAVTFAVVSGSDSPPGGTPDKGKQGTGNADAAVWDGKAIDILWFTDNPNAVSYTLYTPAQLAGLAALVNGLYNVEIDTIRGDMSYIVVNNGSGATDSGGNNQATDAYHYGNYDFAGKIINLGADINMGSANYMPIGGQYLMKPNDTTTRVDASFNGAFNGQGHTVTINTSRHANLYGDGSSVGLIGRLGNHDNEGAVASGQSVRNVIVRGSVYANRSVGGVVGKIGKTIGGAIIENCANYASVSSTDAKGVGGIVGAAWNGGVIRNCYNAGSVSGTHTNPAGGIAGSVEIPIENCYNVGTVTAPSGYAMAIGTNNGGGSVSNVYYLENSAVDGGWYNGSANNDGERTSAYMKSDEFLKDLGNAFKKDTGFNSGYPVLTFGAFVPNTDITTDTPTSESTTVNATIDGDTAIVKISEAEITAILKAIGNSKNGEVRVDISGDNAANIKNVEVEMIVASLKEIVAAGNNFKLTIANSIAAITFDNATIAGLAENKKDNEPVRIIVTKGKIDENYALELTVKISETVIREFKGAATVTAPYSPDLPDSDYDLLTVYYADDEGGYSEIKGAYFDAKAKEIKFTTTHFSKFMVSEWISPFSDIVKGEWYYKSVRYGVSNDLIGGIDGKFLPRTNSSRATMIVLLAKLAGIDIDGGANWYDKAIEWGKAAGITDGTNPTSNITREQLFQLLYNYSGAKPVKADFSKYADADSIHDWALPGMNWAIATGLATGRTATTLNATEPITRSEVVMFLQKFLTAK